MVDDLLFDELLHEAGDAHLTFSLIERCELSETKNTANIGGSSISVDVISSSEGDVFEGRVSKLNSIHCKGASLN